MTSESKAIELETDDQFQKNEWRVQRVGWVVWVGILVVAALGFLGPGLLSQTRSVAADNSLAITYDRFTHFHHPTTLEIDFQVESPQTTELQLAVDQSLLERIDIQRIEPVPKQSVVTSGGVIFVFEKSLQTASGKLILHVDYERPGTVDGNITLVGHSPANVTQFVFP